MFCTRTTSSFGCTALAVALLALAFSGSLTQAQLVPQGKVCSHEENLVASLLSAHPWVWSRGVHMHYDADGTNPQVEHHETEDSDIAISYKEDGTLIIDNGGMIIKGTWEFTDGAYEYNMVIPGAETSHVSIFRITEDEMWTKTIVTMPDGIIRESEMHHVPQGTTEREKACHRNRQTELLEAHPWVFNRISHVHFDKDSGRAISADAHDIDNSEYTQTFFANGTVVVHNPPMTLMGKWNFEDDRNHAYQITFDGDTEVHHTYILRLDEGHLLVKTSGEHPEEGTMVETESWLTKKGVPADPFWFPGKNAAQPEPEPQPEPETQPSNAASCLELRQGDFSCWPLCPEQTSCTAGQCLSKPCNGNGNGGATATCKASGQCWCLNPGWNGNGGWCSVDSFQCQSLCGSNCFCG